jgi:hypothetical protein
MEDNMQDKKDELMDQDPQEQTNAELEGADAYDPNPPRTGKGGMAGDGITAGDGGIDLMSESTTDDGGLAIDGGKLAGNKDNFDQQLERETKNVPGADPGNEVKPPNARDLRQ